MIKEELVETTDNPDVFRLKHDAIKSVFLVPIDRSTLMSYRPYEERPTHYKILLRGERRKRRVYTTPIGNTAVVYLKSGGHDYHCETALDEALNRTEDEDND